MNLYEERIIVAVYLYVYQVKEISTGLSLSPQALSATTPECNLFSRKSLFVSLFIHITQHQHVFRHGILNDGRNQSPTLFKINLHIITIIVS